MAAPRPVIGLIANPMSSKDIRRLVGLARVVDVEEKANLIARFLAGLTAGPPVEVKAFDDPAGLTRRAASLVGEQSPVLSYLALDAMGTEADTRQSAGALCQLGAAALVTVGGDGTVRAAVEGWPEARLIPLSAGTNNAIAIPDEPTVVGMATAWAMAGDPDRAVYRQMTALEVMVDGAEPGVALVDVVGVRTPWTGARALWEPGSFVEAVVSNARPTSVGLASISAALGPVAPGHVRYLRFGPGTDLRVPLGPGLVADVSVAEHREVAEGTDIHLDPACRVVALDGERRLIRVQAASIAPRSGPLLLDVGRTLGTVFGFT